MRDAFAVLLLALTCLLALALYSYTPADPSFNHAVDHATENVFGVVGAWLADFLLQLFGYGALVLLLMLSLWTWRMMRKQTLITGGWRGWFWLPMLIAASGLTQLLMQQGLFGLDELPAGYGGAVGSIIVEDLRLPLGTWGLAILLAALVISCGLVAANISLPATAARLLRTVRKLWALVARCREYAQQRMQRRREHIENRARQRKERAGHIQSVLDQSQEIKLESLLVSQPAAEKAEEAMAASAARPEKSIEPVMIDKILDEVAKQLPKTQKATGKTPPTSAEDAPALAAELASMGLDDIPDVVPDDKETVPETVPAETLPEGEASLTLTTLELPEEVVPTSPHADADQPAADHSADTDQPTKKAKSNKRKQSRRQQKAHRKTTPAPFSLPPMTLFHPADEAQEEYTQEELAAMATLLEEKLRDYKVEGVVQCVKPGPVVTQFEYQPAPGTKVSRIVGLQDDLARSMAAISVRVAGNIPGKNVIGIELPNKKRQIVSLHQVLNSDAFQVDDKLLPMALGVDIAGRPVVTDLASMPHLLVAGTTGSGKSVSINTMICSMLMKHTPDTLRMIMVDPKMLELSMYNDIPHLLVPVVTNPKKAARALDWAVFEMERRYQLMSDAKVRNLNGYNQLAMEKAEMNRLPMIVIVIDELADLMMVAGKDVEQSICRLAQKARAAGLHLILATQRPSVDVITGLIKANLPSRLAFRVSSRVDARTILDQMGAEQLLGQGDALLMTGGCNMSRVHGAFVSDAEVQALTDYLRSQGTPDYHEEVFEAPKGDGANADADEHRDEKFDEAVALVVEKGQCSVSMIQRHMRIGYNRAGRIVDMMEREGIVSAPGTGGMRQVLARSLKGEDE